MAGRTDQRRRKKRNDGPSLGRFFRWWGRELAFLVPHFLRMGEKPSRGLHWVEFGGATATFWRLAGQARIELGHIDLAGDAATRNIAFGALLEKLGGKDLGISLIPGQVLRKTVSLPLAARENLQQVLGFEMDRQTPYAGNQVYFQHEVMREDSARNQIDVRLTVVPRQMVDAAVAHLRDWGRMPRAVAVADELKGDGHYANLLPADLRPKPGPWSALLYGAMALVSLALLFVLLLIPVWQKRETVIAMKPVVADANRRADASNALKTRLEADLARYNYLSEKKLKTVSTVALIDELTRLLPDDTWVQQLDLHGKELQIQGDTGSSARLIGLFEQSRLLSDANFRSPLTKGRGPSTGDRFQLVATVKDVALTDAIAEQEARARQAAKPRALVKAARKAPHGGKIAKPPASISRTPISQPANGKALP
jgi:general secretion pathway protein L